VLTIRQHIPPTPGQPEKDPLVIPIAFGLLGPDGKALPAPPLLLADAAETRFVFDDVPGAPVPALGRGFSAPVRILGYTPDQLRHLARHEPDPFLRWDAGQSYATLALLDDRPEDAGLIEAAAAALDDAETDPAFVAQILSLPSESYLADQRTPVDPAALHAVRTAARAAIGRALAGRLRALYDRLADTGRYRIDSGSIGRRALRNTCLGYLVAGGAPGAVALAKAQFDQGANMTDTLAALSVLADQDAPERAAALASFHARWREDALVLDKWFAIQAGSSRPQTPAEVKALAAHADFDLRNPNRVRALVGAFAANQARFHDASGDGYRFLAEIIAALDPLNPQVAARLVAPLGQWRRMEPGRAALMRAALETVLAAPGLSRNVGEMARKAA
jgi:aminopeptidase N